ncbi:SMI1/KNR4 family protein [Vreelandella zhaodongensis]|uniref:SMI1/KNR4 family protein n=1 Tax=Vreelandella zhaodongensis TaxID=1176240 RepID=UPI003EBF9ECB
MNFNHAKGLLEVLHEKGFSEGASMDSIASLQEYVGRELPEDYVEYLENLGCGFASSEDFLGLGGEPFLDVVTVRRQLSEPSTHSQLPNSFIPLKPDGYGNFDCIDLDQSSRQKSAVVLWLHDGGVGQQRDIIATGFWEWFCKELTSIRDFDAEGF